MVKIVIGVVLIIVLLIYLANKDSKSEEQVFSGCTYIDGSLKVFDSNLYASVRVDKEKIGIGTLKFKIMIPISKLLDYNLKTETDIREQVTLGRLIAFGVFALGMKKQKKEITKYVVLEYLDEQDEKQNIILESKDASMMLNIIHKYKIEYNQKQEQVVN